jgi:hypothetical protein
MMMTSPRQQQRSLPRRRRRSLGVRTFEILAVLTIAAATVVIVTIKTNKLPEQGGRSACLISQAAADRAALTYFASVGDASHWPSTFDDLTREPTRFLVISSGSAKSAHEVAGTDWRLVMQGGGSTQPTFTCK